MVNPKWYGVGQDWKVYTPGFYPPGADVISLWNIEIPKMKAWGFNTVRLGFAFANSGGTTHTVLTNEIDSIINLLNSHGIKTILDCHNWQDMAGYFGSQQWIDDWVNLAQQYKYDDRVVAYELFNEPNQLTWHTSITGGGAGKYDGTDGVNEALAACVDAIRAIGDSHTIVYPDPWFWGKTNTFEWEAAEIDAWKAGSTYRDVVVGLHDYYDANVAQTNTVEEWIGKRVWKAQLWSSKMPVWMGESGILAPMPEEGQKQFNIGLYNGYLALNAGFNFWLLTVQRDIAWRCLDEIMAASNYEPTTPSSPWRQLVEWWKAQSITTKIGIISGAGAFSLAGLYVVFKDRRG